MGRPTVCSTRKWTEWVLEKMRGFSISFVFQKANHVKFYCHTTTPSSFPRSFFQLGPNCQNPGSPYAKISRLDRKLAELTKKISS